MRLAEPLDQATGLRRLFASTPNFHSVGVLGPDARRNARACTALAQGLGRRGNRVLVLDEGRPPYNVGGMMGVLARRTLADVPRIPLGDATVAAAEGVHLLPAPDGMDALASLSEQTLLDITEHWSGDPPEWMLLNSASVANGGGLASTAEIRVLVLPGDKNWLAEAYAVIKSGQAAGSTGRWAVLVEGAENDSAQRLYNSLRTTTQRFLGLSLAYLGCLPRQLDGLEQDDTYYTTELAESLYSVQSENPMNFEQYWQRLWLFSRTTLDANIHLKHAGRRTR